VAVTYGPGLIGSLLVGVETAKSLAYVFDKPLIPVNHLLAHIYANFISSKTYDLKPNPFPFIGLIVSGGHTDLLLFKQHGEFLWLGGTRDDAAGEAFDKIGRVLGFSYPAGPEIERRANLVKRTETKFKSSLINEDNFDFSFSGLKTEAMRFFQNKSFGSNTEEAHEELINQVCFATQKAIIDVLAKKTLKAAEQFNCNTIMIGGGVSANQTFRDTLKTEAKGVSVMFPEKKYSTDNAAMIGAYALLNPAIKSWEEINANPELYFS
jgi:N6-L-threonylcarbamoyladenine synthase